MVRQAKNNLMKAAHSDFSRIPSAFVETENGFKSHIKEITTSTLIFYKQSTVSCPQISSTAEWIVALDSLQLLSSLSKKKKNIKKLQRCRVLKLQLRIRMKLFSQFINHFNQLNL